MKNDLHLVYLDYVHTSQNRSSIQRQIQWLKPSNKCVENRHLILGQVHFSFLPKQFKRSGLALLRKTLATFKKLQLLEQGKPCLEVI